MRFRNFSCKSLDDKAVIYDPCTGLTHLYSENTAHKGRAKLDADQVSSLPVIHPRDIHRSIPFSVCWSPIVACNLHCPHCLDDKSLSNGNRELRFRLVNHITQSGIMGVDISGGEPLLLAELPEIVQLLTRGNLAVSVTTNGWFLEQRVNELFEVVDALRLSFDGHNQTIHDKWRGQNSFKMAIKGLRAARQHHIPVQIQTVAMKSTLPYLQDMMNFAADEGVFGLTILQMLPIGEGAKLSEGEILSDESLKEAISNISTPPSLRVRVRYRTDAAGFMVIRADGSVYRNDEQALSIQKRHLLTNAKDLQTIDLIGTG